LPGVGARGTAGGGSYHTQIERAARRGGRTYSRSYTHYKQRRRQSRADVTATRPNGKTATNSVNRSVNNGAHG